MDHDEQREETQWQRDTARRQQEEDPRRFERIAREVRQEQSPSTGEEGTDEDRRQWEKTRDIRKEASEIPEGPHERTRQSLERSREEQESGGPGED